MFLLFFGLAATSQALGHLDNVNPKFVGPARLLALFSDHRIVAELMLLISIGVLVLAIFATSRSIRVMAAGAFSLVLFICFSYRGSIFHSQHVWLVTSLIMIFIEPNNKLSQKTNLKWLRVAQVLCLSHYFISGCWKLISLLRNPSVEYFRKGVLEHFAFAIAEGQAQGMQVILSLINGAGPLVSLGMLAVLIFQISTIYPILTFKHMKTYGLLAIVFHIVVLISLGIFFGATAAGVALFLIVAESLRELEAEGSQTLVA